LAAAGAALVIGTVAAAAGVGQLREWRTQGRLADTVELRATLQVSSSSMSPPGGRVDYSVTIRNAGPRVIRVDGLRVTQPGLDIESRHGALGDRVRPGGTLDLSLSVRLDCPRRPPIGRSPALRGDVVAVPPNGRPRRVRTTLEGAAPLIDAVQTLCGVSPALRKELSGPLL
jgi:hypothetical protein